MTMKLYSEESIRAIATKIREKDGDTATMTVAQMPERINALVASDEKEVWIQANPGQGLWIDTGVAGDFYHTMEICGYGNIYGSTTLFGSVEATARRQMVDLLTTNNRLRFAWANSGLKTYTYEITQWSAWFPFIIRVNRLGFTMKGFNQNRNSVTLSETITAPTGNASTASYKVFPNVSTTTNNGSTPGVFRSAKIYAQDETTLLHEFVPILKNDFTLVLRDKATGNEVSAPTGENGFSCYYAPAHDKWVEQLSS